MSHPSARPAGNFGDAVAACMRKRYPTVGDAHWLLSHFRQMGRNFPWTTSSSSSLWVPFGLSRTMAIQSRGNLFASACRELLSHLLYRLGPDDEVQDCSWFKQAPDTTGPTRAQRARFAAQGGLPDKLIEDEGYEIDELLRPIVASIKKLNGYVHIRPGKVLNDDRMISQLRDDILAALGDLIEAIRIWRSLIEDVIRNEVEEAAKAALTDEVMAEVDLLATAHRIDHVETTKFEISRVGATTFDLNRVHFGRRGFGGPAPYLGGDEPEQYLPTACCTLTMPGGVKHRRTCGSWPAARLIRAPASAPWPSTRWLKEAAPRRWRRAPGATRRP